LFHDFFDAGEGEVLEAEVGGGRVDSTDFDGFVDADLLDEVFCVGKEGEENEVSK